MNSTLSIILLVLVAQLIAGVAGFWLGRNTKPWRKTRYFVNEDGNLVRWKDAARGSYVLVNGSMLFSKRELSSLLKNCQEISPLKAYQMFPKAFKK